MQVLQMMYDPHGSVSYNIDEQFKRTFNQIYGNQYPRGYLDTLFNISIGVLMRTPYMANRIVNHSFCERLLSVVQESLGGLFSSGHVNPHHFQHAWHLRGGF